jgi:hypothetical protein
MEMQMQGLMNLTLQPLKRSIHKWVLDKKRNHLYMVREHFVKEYKNGLAGMRECDRHLVNIEARLRDLK